MASSCVEFSQYQVKYKEVKSLDSSLESTTMLNGLYINKVLITCSRD